ncbi:hypothetical protein E2C01_023192 [Portunus trituberculatus]|uniref:Uncharacterized protein n=1 Tax=Portunus trituberculatus TaxID=210409 RepID=A0A5B7E936_PORTR|nr:hypothetical protein [Portunus trituberculatus]
MYGASQLCSVGRTGHLNNYSNSMSRYLSSDGRNTSAICFWTIVLKAFHAVLSYTPMRTFTEELRCLKQK